MKRFKLSLISLLMGVATLLTACGDGVSFTGPNFTVQTNPSPMVVDINVTDKGIEYVNTAHTFSFASRQGATGARIEGYDIEFYDSSNNPVFVGDSVARSSGSLSVYIPAGLTCDELKANPTFDNCTVNSAGANFTPGPVRQGPPSNFLVPADIALSLYNLLGKGGAVGAYALVYFYGTDDLGRPFRSTPYQFSLIII
jgi:hypothetical protein